jgi:hypothetical protein
MRETNSRTAKGEYCPNDGGPVVMRCLRRVIRKLPILGTALRPGRLSLRLTISYLIRPRTCSVTDGTANRPLCLLTYTYHGCPLYFLYFLYFPAATTAGARLFLRTTHRSRSCRMMDAYAHKPVACVELRPLRVSMPVILHRWNLLSGTGFATLGDSASGGSDYKLRRTVVIFICFPPKCPYIACRATCCPRQTGTRFRFGVYSSCCPLFRRENLGQS